MKRGICALLTLAFIFLSASWAEEAADEARIVEVSEVDLLSPEIYVDNAAPEAQPPESEAPVEGAAGEATPPATASDDAPTGEAVAEEAPKPEEAPAPVEAPASEPSAEAAVAAPQAMEAAPEEPAPQTAETAPEEAAALAPVAFISALMLGVKEQATLNGIEVSGGSPVSYVSTKPKIASVDANGIVIARRRGEAVITCYQGETPIGECHVSVFKAPRKIAFPDKKIVLSKDQALAYPAVLPKGCYGTITYASDNPAVLSVDAAGNLVGVSGGMATLTATTYNGKSAKCAVRVLGGPAPTWVALNETALAMPVKGTAQLTASFDEGRDALVAFTTSNKKVVRVSETGLVTARKAGQAMVTVTTHNGLSATCQVQVYTAPKKVTLNAKKLALRVNDAFQLTATLTKNSISEITWASDNPAVAQVDGNGFVIAQSEGKATIVATTTNGKKAKCKVTVKGDAGTTPTPSGIRGTVVYQEESDTLKVTISKDGGLYLAYIWVQNPSQQLFKQYGDSQPGTILQEAVNARGLQGRMVIGFNASPPVNSTYHADLNKDPNYRLREPSPLMIANGEVLVNDPNKSIKGKYLYWMDGSGHLRHSGKRLQDMSVDERRNLYADVIDSGARNTMIWQPVLVSDSQATYLSDEFQKQRDGKQKKHALCQVDDNNFIVVSSSNSGKMTYPEFQNYILGLGCKTAVEFDAGGSTSLLWKSRNSAAVQKVTGGSRSLTMVMFFTE